MACGRPVIAFGSGGALETVKQHETGLFFRRQTPEDLRAAILEFEALESRFDRRTIRKHAETFSEARFHDEFLAIVEQQMEHRTPGRPAARRFREIHGSPLRVLTSPGGLESASNDI
jgi:hypothetical protein